MTDAAVPVDAAETGSARAFAGVMLVSLSVFVTIGALTPVLPRYLTSELEQGRFVVGVVMGGFAVVALLFRPLAGFLSDRIGRRTTAIVGGLVTAASAGLFFWPGMVGVASARFGFGIGEAMLTGATMSWAVDLAPLRRRGQMIGLYGLSIWIGLMIGPQIGVALLAHGYGAVWIFACASPLCGALVAASLPGGRPRSHGDRPSFPLLRRLIPGAVVRPGIAVGLCAAGDGVIAAFLVLHLAAVNLGGDDPIATGARVYTVFAIAVTAARLLAGGLTDRIGGVRSALVGSLFEAVGLALIALATGLPGVLIGAVSAGIGFSILFPALAVLAVNEVDVRRRGAAMASFTAFFDAGIAVGSVAGGAIAAAGTYSDAFWFAAICALAIGVVMRGPRNG